ncbi:MAG: plasmid pRiA4b ORF-3 family protein [Phaeodactylibacter sp.]|nr:plasmid pRiA4b ORF-3 family protein [Phaeodactylibacter sp.]
MAKILTFKISLVGAKPPIWRRFQVADTLDFEDFHAVIQIVMGWWNSHLHEFLVRDRRIGMVLPDIDIFEPEDMDDETEIFLHQLKLKVGEKLSYTYDFGDNWEHELVLEEVAEGDLELPRCLTGKGACPPEDCGGIWGYEEILTALKDPENPDYADLLEWLPEEFDPAAFSEEEVNEEIEEEFEE